jgi:hypothetical protein
MGTSLTLAYQAFREERLQGLGQVRSCGTSEVPLQTLTDQRQQLRRS